MDYHKPHFSAVINLICVLEKMSFLLGLIFVAVFLLCRFLRIPYAWLVRTWRRRLLSSGWMNRLVPGIQKDMTFKAVFLTGKNSCKGAKNL